VSDPKIPRHLEPLIKVNMGFNTDADLICQAVAAELDSASKGGLKSGTFLSPFCPNRLQALQAVLVEVRAATEKTIEDFWTMPDRGAILSSGWRRT
jgi:hypothetical protein